MFEGAKPLPSVIWGGSFVQGGVRLEEQTRLLPGIIAGCGEVTAGGLGKLWRGLKCRRLSSIRAANQINPGRRVRGFVLE